jgi:3-oxoacyl-[acyl-carrier protein] reductase
LFAKNNFRVLALSRNTLPLEQEQHPNITPLSIDISKTTDLEKVKTYIETNWSQVDLLINNAGMLLNKPFEDTTKEDFMKVYNVNVFGVAELIRKVLPHLKKGSHVVNISSMGGIQGSMKFAGLSAYSSSKGALITLTELLAEEYREHGIAFNVLALGAVQTEMLSEAFPDFKAPLQPSEMAAYLFDFATTGSRYYNGKVLQVSSTTP